jgi:hypothetical protein
MASNRHCTTFLRMPELTMAAGGANTKPAIALN